MVRRFLFILKFSSFRKCVTQEAVAPFYHFLDVHCFGKQKYLEEIFFDIIGDNTYISVMSNALVEIFFDKALKFK